MPFSIPSAKKRSTEASTVFVAADGWCYSASQAAILSARPSGRAAPPGSLTLTRPGLSDFTESPEHLQQRAGDVFRLVERGELRIRIDDVLPLERAPEAHERLEARATTGKLVLNVKAP